MSDLSEFAIGDRVRCIKYTYVYMAPAISVGAEGSVSSMSVNSNRLYVTWDFFQSSALPIDPDCVALLEQKIEYTVLGEKNIFDNDDLFSEESQQRLWQLTMGSKWR